MSSEARCDPYEGWTDEEISRFEDDPANEPLISPDAVRYKGEIVGYRGQDKWNRKDDLTVGGHEVYTDFY